MPRRDDPPHNKTKDDSSTSRHWVAKIAGSSDDPTSETQVAWAKLEERYRARLLAYAKRQMGSGPLKLAEPEDVVSEAWGRAFKHIGAFEYRGPLSFYHWLKLQVWRVVGELARTANRRKGDAATVGAPASSFEPEEIAALESGPHSRAARREVRSFLDSALEDIAEHFRDILREHHYQGLSHEEIARRRGRLANTVTHQLKRGLAAWRKSLDERHGPGAFDAWFPRR